MPADPPGAGPHPIGTNIPIHRASIRVVVRPCPGSPATPKVTFGQPVGSEVGGVDPLSAVTIERSLSPLAETVTRYR